MTITIASEIEQALLEAARRQGTTPEALLLEVLRERFGMPSVPPLLDPQDDWETRVRGIGTDCGTSLSNEAVSSEGIYE